MKQGKDNSFAKRMHWSWQTPSCNNTREDSAHGHNQMVNTEIRLIIFFTAKDGESLYSHKKNNNNNNNNNKTRSWLWLRSWILIAKFILKLKQVGKTTRPFRYDLNQIPYDYTVEVTDRFKGLDLIECRRTMDWGSWHCTGGRDQDHPQEKEMRKGKMVV